MTLHPHSQNWISTICLPVDYPDELGNPKFDNSEPWDRFIASLFPDESPELAWEVLGRSLSPCKDLHEALFLIGSGANGKSTFLDAIPLLIGTDNISRVKVGSIDSNRFAVADLYGKLANIDTDTETSSWKETSKFKQVVENAEMLAERKHQPGFLFRPHCAMFLAGNSLPQADDKSQGFYRRLTVVPFIQHFPSGGPATRQHSEILEELRQPAALSGALMKALQGLVDVRRRGCFYKSPIVQETMDEFVQLDDPTGDFVKGYLSGRKGEQFLPKEELKNAYNEWAKEYKTRLKSTHAMTVWVNRVKRGKDGEGWSEVQRTVNGKRVRGWLVRVGGGGEGGGSWVN